MFKDQVQDMELNNSERFMSLMITQKIEKTRLFGLLIQNKFHNQTINGSRCPCRDSSNQNIQSFKIWSLECNNYLA